MGDFGKVIMLLVLMIASIGVIGTLAVLGDVAELMGTVIIEANKAVFEAIGRNTVTEYTKHFVTYKIVGLILSTGVAGGSVFMGKIIGKIAYVLVGIGVLGIINFIMLFM